MKRIGALLLACAAATCWSPAAGAETKLLIGTWAPPTHCMNASVLPAWAQQVRQATQGRVVAEMRYNLARPDGQLEAVRDGIEDVAWIYHGFHPGTFVSARIMQLPFLGADAEAGSRAYWRVFQQYLSKADEHRGVVVLGLMTPGAGVIISRNPVTSWADLKGMKVRLPGGLVSRLGEALGAVPVTVAPGQLYDALSQNRIGGVFMPPNAYEGFRLAEVTRYILRVPGNLYDDSFAIIMNRRKFDSLGKEDQAALMSVSGETLSALAGRQWDAANQAGYRRAREAAAVVTDAGPAMLAQLHKAAAILDADWIKHASGHGYDAAAALKALRATARQLAKN
jgi:TRAP-type C4-dicarboxylate transport system substrate-binding protein